MDILEWRAIGIQQSRGWEHYLLHKPEPNILLFRRPIQTDQRTGKIINGNNNPYNWQTNCDTNNNNNNNKHNNMIANHNTNTDNNNNNGDNNNKNSNLKADWKPNIESCLPTLQTINSIQNLILQHKKNKIDSKYGYY